MSDPLARIVVADHHNQPLVRITGEVDMSNVPTVTEQLHAAIGDAATVYIDLTELEFLDSQGLRMLQRLADDLGRRDASIVVIAPPSGVAGSLLALTAMDKNLDVRPALPD